VKQDKSRALVTDGLILFIGCILAVAIPFVIVPLALLLALLSFMFKRWRIVRPDVPTLGDMFYRGQVVVTTRVVLLLLFGTLPLMQARTHTGAVSLWFIYNFVVFLLVIIDVVISPRPENLTKERPW